MPISLGPIIAFALCGAILVGGWFLVDAIGDRREAFVRAEYAEAARRKNVDITAFNSADDALSAITEAALKEHLAKAQQVPGTCTFTPEQAAALSAIRKVR